MIRRYFVIACCAIAPIVALATSTPAADESPAFRALDPVMHHLRHGVAREWAEFPDGPADDTSIVHFDAKANPTEQTLRVRHRDLKFSWVIRLNGKEIASLPK